MWRRMGLALLLSALVSFALPAFADSNARIVRLSYVDGSVEVDRGDGQGFHRAILNMPVVQGTQLAARAGGTAEVEFEDGSTVRLAPDTSIIFQSLSLRDSGDRVNGIRLSSGTAYFDLRDKKDEFTIIAGGRSIRIDKDSRFRVSRQGSEVRVAVFKGETEVGQQKVKKNETFLADATDPARDQLSKGIDQESYDDWAKQRDQYQQTYASNHGYGYSPAYSYGWSDLNYFGGFYNYPGYGYLWRPYGVDPFWDPFTDGAWMNYPGFGWTFVSAYPWGWMPYRYGSWTFVPGFGWAWQPGYWNRWYAVPVVNRPPSGFVAPKPPSTGTGVVSVGKGPIHGVKDPRFGQWVTNATTGEPGTHHPHSNVTPVGTATGTAANGTTSTSTTTSGQPAKEHGSHQRPQQARPATPQRSTPPAKSAPTTGPKAMSAPREMSMPEPAMPAASPVARGNAGGMRSGGRMNR